MLGSVVVLLTLIAVHCDSFTIGPFFQFFNLNVMQQKSKEGQLASLRTYDRSKPNLSNQVKNVAIVGGTHGNELHGIYFVDEINSPEVSIEMKKRYPSIDLRGVLANPAAMKAIGTGAGRRYCDMDLNRCFLVKDLADPTASASIEGQRAKELDALLGPKASQNPNTDFIFDIHSSTSNTGILLCCHPDDKFAWQVVAFLQQKHPDISACLWADGEVPLLPSLARSGMTVEVGPIAHSTANSALYHRTKEVLKDALQYIELHNTWVAQEKLASSSGAAATQVDQKPAKVRFYERVASVGFPRDETGQISALIHPNIQGQPELTGGTAVTRGSPVFQTLRDGDDIFYGEDIKDARPGYVYRVEHASVSNSEFSAEMSLSVSPDMESRRGLSDVGSKRKRSAVSSLAAVASGGDMESRGFSRLLEDDDVEDLYPMFINEAAYNEKDIAFVLMRRTERLVSIVTSEK